MDQLLSYDYEERYLVCPRSNGASALPTVDAFGMAYGLLHDGTIRKVVSFGEGPR